MTESILESRRTRQMACDVFARNTVAHRYVKELDDAWGYGGSTTAKNSASPALIDLEALGVVRCLWLPGQAGNYVSTPDINEIDYDSSTFENNVGKWEGLNKNLLTANQSSLETDTTGWSTGANMTRARSTAQAFNGSASMSMTATAAGDMYTGQTDIPSMPKVVPGQVYTASAMFRAAATSRNVRLRITWYTESGSISTITGADNADNTAGWQQTVVVGQAPANATRANVEVRVVGCAAGEVHYVDTVGLFETPNGNLVVNSDFESTAADAAPWDAYNSATVAHSTEQAYTGRGSALVSWNGNINARYVVQPGLIVGQTYTASMWVWVPAGHTPVTMEIANLSGSSTAATTVTGQWVRLVKTFVCNNTVNGPQIGPASTPGAGHQVYVDAVQLVVGSAAVEYLPPTTYNFATDPSMVNAGTWDLSGAGDFSAASVSIDRAYVGTTSLKCTSTGMGADGGSGIVNASRVILASQMIENGIRYTASVYVWSAVAVKVKLQDFGTFAEAPLVNVPAATWTRCTGTFVSNGTSSSAIGQVQVLVESINGNNVYLDAYQVELGSVATPYTDGSLGAGYVWEASENLISAASASFEDATVGAWTNNNVGGSFGGTSTAQAFVGTRSMLVQTNGSGQAINLPVQVVAGTAYAFSLYVRSDVAGSVTLSGPAVGNASSGAIATLTTGWTRITVVGTASASGTVNLTVVFGAAATYYIDAAQVEQRTYATPYGQVGTAHASTSRRETPWILGGTSIEALNLSSNTFHQGTRSVLVTGNVPNVTSAVRGVVLRALLLSASTQYTVSVYTHNEAATKIRVVTSDGSWYESAERTATTMGRTTLTFTTNAGVTSGSIYVIRTNTKINPNWYMDAVQLEKASAATTYTLPLRITGDIDLRARVALEDWTPGVEAALLGTYGSTGYFLSVFSDGRLRLWSPDNVTSTIAPSVTDGQRKYVRATRVASTGVVTFYTSDDGVAWTQLGLSVTGVSGAISIGQELKVGGLPGRNDFLLKSKVLSAEVRAGINGTVVARYDATVHTADTYTDAYGKVWTISRSGDATAEIVDRNTWAFTGTEYLTLPDRKELDFEAGQSFTLMARLHDRNANTLNRPVVSKRSSNGGATTGWDLVLDSGTLRPRIQLGDGVTSRFAVSETFVAGWHTIGGMYDVSSGAVSAYTDGAAVSSSGAVLGSVATSNALRVGGYPADTDYPLGALVSWVALFRRVLTAAEHAALAAWDGTWDTEPPWLRTAAALYVNADEPQTKLRYVQHNRVINLKERVA